MIFILIISETNNFAKNVAGVLVPLLCISSNDAIYL